MLRHQVNIWLGTHVYFDQSVRILYVSREELWSSGQRTPLKKPWVIFVLSSIISCYASKVWCSLSPFTVRTMSLRKTESPLTSDHDPYRQGCTISVFIFWPGYWCKMPYNTDQRIYDTRILVTTRSTGTWSYDYLFGDKDPGHWSAWPAQGLEVSRFFGWMQPLHSFHYLGGHMQDISPKIFRNRWSIEEGLSEKVHGFHFLSMNPFTFALFWSVLFRSQEKARGIHFVGPYFYLPRLVQCVSLQELLTSVPLLPLICIHVMGKYAPSDCRPLATWLIRCPLAPSICSIPFTCHPWFVDSGSEILTVASF